MVTESIREPHMFLGQFFMLFQAVLWVCSVSDTICQSEVSTFTVTLTEVWPAEAAAVGASGGGLAILLVLWIPLI